MHALPRIADMGQDDGLFRESLMAAIAQGDDAAKSRMRAFLDGKAAKVAKSPSSAASGHRAAQPNYRKLPLGGSLTARFFEARADGEEARSSRRRRRAAALRRAHHRSPRALGERGAREARSWPSATTAATGVGWSYAQALADARAIAQALLDHRLSAERPLAILSDNDIEHLLLGLGAMLAGVPYAPISAAYSLLSQDHGKLRHILGVLTPGPSCSRRAESCSRRRSTPSCQPTRRSC